MWDVSKRQQPHQKRNIRSKYSSICSGDFSHTLPTFMDLPSKGFISREKYFKTRIIRTVKTNRNRSALCFMKLLIIWTEKAEINWNMEHSFELKFLYKNPTPLFYLLRLRRLPSLMHLENFIIVSVLVLPVQNDPNFLICRRNPTWSVYKTN